MYWAVEKWLQDMDKSIIFGTACDEKNFGYAVKLVKSFRHFHPEIPIVVYTTMPTLKAHKALPPKTRVVDISKEVAKDELLFYKQKPYFADKLFREGYSAVLLGDADQIILGNLDYILNSKGYDVGTVLNFNPLDFRVYGPITVQGVHYATEYYNAGLVMMRSHAFVKHWLKLCNSKYFARFTYREQDLLNVLAHFCNYQVKCFDDADDYENYYAWHGLLASRETLKMQMVNGEVYLPASGDGYPSRDVIIKVFHPAGGQTTTDKLNYRTAFNEDVIEYIDNILK